MTARRHRRARVPGILARRRRRQNAVMLAVFLLVQLLAWLFLTGVWSQLAVLVVSALAVPVLMTLLLDRRS